MEERRFSAALRDQKNSPGLQPQAPPGLKAFLMADPDAALKGRSSTVILENSCPCLRRSYRSALATHAEELSWPRLSRRWRGSVRRSRKPFKSVRRQRLLHHGAPEGPYVLVFALAQDSRGALI